MAIVIGEYAGYHDVVRAEVLSGDRGAAVFHRLIVCFVEELIAVVLRPWRCGEWTPISPQVIRSTHRYWVKAPRGDAWFGQPGAVGRTVYRGTA